MNVNRIVRTGSKLVAVACHPNRDAEIAVNGCHVRDAVLDLVAVGVDVTEVVSQLGTVSMETAIFIQGERRQSCQYR